MIEKHCYDIFQPDATFTGGIAQTFEVSKLCRQHGLKFTPHTWTNGIGFAINLQLLAASGFEMETELEYPINPPGWTVEARDGVLEKPFDHDRGMLEVPSEPGLGFRVNQAALRKYGKRYFVMDRKRLVWFSLRTRGLGVSRVIRREQKKRRKRQAAGPGL
jgi:D-galactarolactone cycloisomerase